MARRILVMIDDFNENRKVEAILRKVGFDVVGLVTESSLNEQILAFGPEVIVTSGQGPKLSAISIASKLKEHRTFHGQVILGFPSGTKITSQDLLRARVDRILDAPFRPEALIQAVAQLLKMDGTQLIDRLQKLHLPEDDGKRDHELQIVKGKHDSEPIEIVRNMTREERYRRIAKNTDIDKQSTTFSKNSVRDHWKEVKKSWNENAIDNMKRLKMEFAKALFSRKK